MVCLASRCARKSDDALSVQDLLRAGSAAGPAWGACLLVRAAVPGAGAGALGGAGILAGTAQLRADLCDRGPGADAAGRLYRPVFARSCGLSGRGGVHAGRADRHRLAGCACAGLRPPASPPRAPPQVGGPSLESATAFPFLCLGLTVVCTLAVLNLLRSPTGRAFVAIRDSEISAQSMGIHLAHYKTLSFSLSAALAGIGGALYAHKLQFISPDQFGIMQSIDLLLMVVVGGL